MWLTLWWLRTYIVERNSRPFDVQLFEWYPIYSILCKAAGRRFPLQLSQRTFMPQVFWTGFLLFEYYNWIFPAEFLHWISKFSRFNHRLNSSISVTLLKQSKWFKWAHIAYNSNFVKMKHRIAGMVEKISNRSGREQVNSLLLEESALHWVTQSMNKTRVRTQYISDEKPRICFSLAISFPSLSLSFSLWPFWVEIQIPPVI